MSVLMRRENTLIIEPGSDISKIQIINFILLPNSKKHFEGPPLQQLASEKNIQLFCTSALTNEGINELIEAIWETETQEGENQLEIEDLKTNEVFLQKKCCQNNK
ncbi:P-loop_containing nucleoside triphosphate hydrolase [Hexamita inflata]|uniref:P-loop_containing nucleoside triphosphate hydrolase n=1 Tax=Hexamita inflata TaxID=28002 RepID=A0ABP1IAU3_9EUKA